MPTRMTVYRFMCDLCTRVFTNHGDCIAHEHGHQPGDEHDFAGRDELLAANEARNERILAGDLDAPALVKVEPTEPAEPNQIGRRARAKMLARSEMRGKVKIVRVVRTVKSRLSDAGGFAELITPDEPGQQPELSPLCSVQVVVPGVDGKRVRRKTHHLLTDEFVDPDDESINYNDTVERRRRSAPARSLVNKTPKRKRSRSRERSRSKPATPPEPFTGPRLPIQAGFTVFRKQIPPEDINAMRQQAREKGNTLFTQVANIWHSMTLAERAPYIMAGADEESLKKNQGLPDEQYPAERRQLAIELEAMCLYLRERGDAPLDPKLARTSYPDCVKNRLERKREEYVWKKLRNKDRENYRLRAKELLDDADASTQAATASVAYTVVTQTGVVDEAAADTAPGPSQPQRVTVVQQSPPRQMLAGTSHQQHYENIVVV